MIKFKRINEYHFMILYYKLMNRWTVLKFQIQFLKYAGGNFLERVKKLNRFTQFYIHHKTLQQVQIYNKLHSASVNEQSYIQIIAKDIQKYLKRNQTQQNIQTIKKNIFKTADKHQQNIKKGYNYEQQLKGVTQNMFHYLSLYYESLQALVEGRRQVLHDQNFKFQDGKTVKDKRLQFQRFLEKLFRKKIKKDEYQQK